MPNPQDTGSIKNLRPHLNSAGKMPQPFLLVIPALLALGIVLMFIVGKTGNRSKNVLYEDLETRMRRLEQRLARLEQSDRKSSLYEEKGQELNANISDRLEKLERSIPRPPEAIAGLAATKPGNPEKQPRSDRQANPQPLEKARKEGLHQVIEGDTLFKISRIYGVSVDDLRRWNNMRAGDGIRTGQTLRVSDPSR